MVHKQKKVRAWWPTAIVAAFIVSISSLFAQCGAVAFAQSTGRELDWKQSVRLATTAALPACTASSDGLVLTATTSGALSVNGVAVALNDSILVKDQVAGRNNGIYKVTRAGSVSQRWQLTRRNDANEN